MKAPATLASVPQSKDDCAAQIRALGDAQRMYERQRAQMNDLIASITEDFAPLMDSLTQRITALQAGIQTWCESHRVELCGEGDRLGKTANLVTGEVSWRQRPPSVSVRGVDTVLDTLERMGLERFIRTKREVNKEAMLAEPDAVRGLAGVSIVTGVEDFVITPFEVPASPEVA
ncbi:MAG: host-nuclease inhibitor Gam family protein [Burkholderiaceae bacterium]|jgi:phage host-nuclease inhibitor protein Gam|nr:host-nuclease inhibitor Gam family protein [Burkholderiaceae bacterium]